MHIYEDYNDFREKNPDVKIIGAQPAEQSKKNPAFPDRNTIDGVLNFNGVPEQNYPPLFTAFDTKWDECFDVVAEDAYETGRKLVSTEGFFVGQSAGAALWVATQIAKRPEAKGKNIVDFYKTLSNRELLTYALSCFREACEEMSRRYKEGDGCEQNDDKAHYWLNKADSKIPRKTAKLRFLKLIGKQIILYHGTKLCEPQKWIWQK